MKIDSDRVAELLQEKDNILILTHKNPDGDTLGCGVALCRVLQGLGKTLVLRIRISYRRDILIFLKTSKSWILSLSL